MIKLDTTTAYTVQEAAEIMNKSISTIRYYIRTGKLRAHKVGNSYYVTTETLHEFVTGERIERTY